MNFAVYQTEKGMLEVRPIISETDKLIQVSQSFWSQGRAIVERQKLAREMQLSIARRGS